MSPFCVVFLNGFAYVYLPVLSAFGLGVVCGCQGTDVEVRGQPSEILSFRRMGSRYQSQVIRFSRKGLYTLSHFTVSLLYCVYLVFRTGHKQFESGQGVRLKTIAQSSGVPQSLQWSSNSKTERESKVQV